MLRAMREKRGCEKQGHRLSATASQAVRPGQFTTGKLI